MATLPKKIEARFLKKNNTLAALSILLDWLIVFAAACASEWIDSWIAYVIACLIIGGRMVSLRQKWTHEAIHGTLFQPFRWNRLLQWLYAYPCFATIESEAESHLYHHRAHPNDSNGPACEYEYLYLTEGIAQSKWKMLLWLLFVMPVAGFVWQVHWMISYVFQQPRTVLRMWIFWLLVVVVSLAGLGWHGCYLLFAYWIVPFAAVYCPLVALIELAQHYNTAHAWYTRDLHGWFFVVFGANCRKYHTVHHEHPGIPWFRQKEATQYYFENAPRDMAYGLIDLMRQFLDVPACSKRGLRKSGESPGGTEGAG
jgi:fatty acid desaturase